MLARRVTGTSYTGHSHSRLDHASALANRNAMTAPYHEPLLPGADRPAAAGAEARPGGDRSVAAPGGTARLGGLFQGRQIFSYARTDHLADPGACDAADQRKPNAKLRQPVTPGRSPPGILSNANLNRNNQTAELARLPAGYREQAFASAYLVE